MARYDYVAVTRTLAILELLGNSPEQLTLTEIANSLEIDKSTAHRLLRVLCERNFVSRFATTRRYAMRFSPSQLGASAVVVRSVERLVRPLLLRVSSDIGETVRLAALEGSDVRYWAEVGALRPGSNMLGAVIDAHASATGKVLLASRSLDEVEKLYRGRALRSYTSRTIRSYAALLAELKRVRQQGWAVNDGELSRPDIRSLAVPCMSAGGEVPFAIGVSGPGSRLTAQRDAEIVPKLRLAATQVVDALGLREQASQAKIPATAKP
jgi:DNA-binding IclR family transcriptional regulator